MARKVFGKGMGPATVAYTGFTLGKAAGDLYRNKKERKAKNDEAKAMAELSYKANKATRKSKDSKTPKPKTRRVKGEGGTWEVHEKWAEIHGKSGSKGLYDDVGFVRPHVKDTRIKNAPNEKNVQRPPKGYDDVGVYKTMKDKRLRKPIIGQGEGALMYGKRKKKRKDVLGSDQQYFFADGGSVTKHPTRMCACGGKVKK